MKSLIDAVIRPVRRGGSATLQARRRRERAARVCGDGALAVSSDTALLAPVAAVAHRRTSSTGILG